MVDQALQAYFGFDEADLVANRNGQFSEKQTKKLFDDPRSVTGRLRALLGGLVGGVLLLALAAILAVPFITHGLTAVREQDPVSAIFLLVGGGIWALVWGYFAAGAAWGGLSAALGLLPKIVLQSVRGPANLVGVQVSRSGGHRYIQHELHVGGRSWKVAGTLADIIRQGDNYAIYFTDDATILSAERLS